MQRYTKTSKNESEIYAQTESKRYKKRFVNELHLLLKFIQKDRLSLRG